MNTSRSVKAKGKNVHHVISCPSVYAQGAIALCGGMFKRMTRTNQEVLSWNRCEKISMAAVQFG